MDEEVQLVYEMAKEKMEKAIEHLETELSRIRAGKANMFLSGLFTQTLSNISGSRIELYNTDGSEGAARGAGVGAGYFKDTNEAFKGLSILEAIEPEKSSNIKVYYNEWVELLNKTLEE